MTLDWENVVALLATGFLVRKYAIDPAITAWIRIKAARRVKRQVPLSQLHRYVPERGELSTWNSWRPCRLCALNEADTVHLHPYNEPLTINNVSVPPASGTLGELAYEVFQLDMGAVIYEATGFPMTVFVELDEHVETAALREKVRRAIWWVKIPGVLVVIVGHGALRYDVSDEERWLKEASK